MTKRPKNKYLLLLTLFASAILGAGVAHSDQLRQYPESKLHLVPAPRIAMSMSDNYAFASDGFDGVGSDFSTDKAKSNQTKLYSPLKAAAMSLVVPGAGQWYTGHHSQARIFGGAEIGIWLTFAAFKTFAGWKEDDFVRYAQRHAGVTPAGKNDDFYRLLGFYESRELFNTIGRAFEPDAAYIPDSPAWDWSWDSPESQQQFRDLRNDWNSANRNADFMFVAAAANHLTSAVFAWIQARRANNSLDATNEFSSRDASRKNESGVTTSVTFSSPMYSAPAAGGLLCNVTFKF